MAKLNYQYYTGIDNYTDGEIEIEMLNYAKKHKYLDNNAPSDIEFPYIYHFAKARENILNWYPFKTADDILEIGSGCGAITGLLCRKVNRVISIELSKQRALINYERHKEYENLEIIVGNFDNIKLNLKFDYIILNGVFEYAISFIKGKDPYVDFLKKITPYLKDKGKVLIAIENRLGLKYFSGAFEDHTDRIFLGINNYRENNSVRTFSKNELVSILKKSLLNEFKFYYPYPDYKFPQEIFTDLSLQQQHYGRSYCNYNKNRLKLFDEEIVYTTLKQEKVLDTFANSFLVEASFNLINCEEEIIYVKLNSNRSEKFQIYTDIVEMGREKKVRKRALSLQAKEHINRIYLNSFVKQHPHILFLKGEKENNGLVYDFLNSKSLDIEVNEMINKGKENDAIDIIDIFFGYLFESAVKKSDYGDNEFCQIFGNTLLKEELFCIKPANIDLILDNIYRINQEYIVIDCEWIFDIWIPITFIIWRSINEIYAKHPELKNLIIKEFFWKKYNITNDLEEEYKRWNLFFVHEYVQVDQLSRFRKDDIVIELSELCTKYKKSNLYYDIGEGYSEEQKIVSQIYVEKEAFLIKYDISRISSIKNLRWDPMEQGCECKVEALEIDDKKREIIPINCSFQKNGFDWFLTVDPQYKILGEFLNCKKIVIKGQIKEIEDRKLISILQDNLNTVYLSRGWKIYSNLKSFYNKFQKNKK